MAVCCHFCVFFVEFLCANQVGVFLSDQIQIHSVVLRRKASRPNKPSTTVQPIIATGRLGDHWLLAEPGNKLGEDCLFVSLLNV